MLALTIERLARALEMLGRVLADRDATYEVVIVGGAALTLNGFSVRPTQDVDAIAVGEPPDTRPRRVHALPGPLAEAVADVAAALGLEDDWLNWQSARSFLLSRWRTFSRTPRAARTGRSG